MVISGLDWLDAVEHQSERNVICLNLTTERDKLHCAMIGASQHEANISCIGAYLLFYHGLSYICFWSTGANC